jgi:hypothetical protein
MWYADIETTSEKGNLQEEKRNLQGILASIREKC